jgi:hypothetical protein
VRPDHVASFDEGMLERSIHHLNRRYAVGFNRRHDRRGHVFDSPYASVEVVEEAHGEWIDTYIADNPMRRPWPWSSYDAEFAFVVQRERFMTRPPADSPARSKPLRS